MPNKKNMTDLFSRSIEWMTGVLSRSTEWIIGYIFIFIGFISPIIPFILLVVLLVVYDTFYAIKSVIKKEGFKSVISHKFFNIAPKICFYGGAIIVSYLGDIYIISENTIYNIPFILSKIITVAFIANEIKSIDEKRVLNGKTSVFDMVKNVFRWLKNLKKNLKEVIKDE